MTDCPFRTPNCPAVCPFDADSTLTPFPQPAVIEDDGADDAAINDQSKVDAMWADVDWLPEHVTPLFYGHTGGAVIPYLTITLDWFLCYCDDDGETRERMIDVLRGEDAA